MAKLYLEIEIEVSGTVTPGFPPSYMDPGHDAYCDDAEVDGVTFEFLGKTYDLLHGLSKESRDQVCLNLTDALHKDMSYAVLCE